MPSDNWVGVVEVVLPRVQAFRWMKHSYRYYNEESVERFKNWVVLHDWKEVLSTEGSQNKAVAYQGLVDRAIADFFPLITVRRKITDLPWVNGKARRLIKRRKAIYRRHGRNAAWKRLSGIVCNLLRERKMKNEQSQKLCLLAEDAVRHFWKIVRITSRRTGPSSLTQGNCFLAERMLKWRRRWRTTSTLYRMSSVPQSRETYR